MSPSADASLSAAGSPSTEISLDELLARLGRAATVYADNALRFDCRETVTQKIFHHSGGVRHEKSKRFRYIYVFQAEKGLVDYRTTAPSSGSSENRPRGSAGTTEPNVPPDETVSPEATFSPRPVTLEDQGFAMWVSRAYSWIFVFRPSLQGRYRYELDGSERVDGVEAVRVRFHPVPPSEPNLNDWHGTAWIDPATAQLVRVEAMKADQYEEWRRLQENLERASSDDQDYVVTWIITEFGVVKNGMRFPDRVVLRRSAYRLAGRLRILRSFRFPGMNRTSHDTGYVEQPLVQVEQVYDRYRFFSVRSQTEFLNYVLGDDEGP